MAKMTEIKDDEVFVMGDQIFKWNYIDKVLKQGINLTRAGALPAPKIISVTVVKPEKEKNKT
jgi:hypothetical protein